MNTNPDINKGKAPHTRLASEYPGTFLFVGGADNGKSLVVDADRGSVNRASFDAKRRPVTQRYLPIRLVGGKIVYVLDSLDSFKALDIILDFYGSRERFAAVIDEALFFVQPAKPEAGCHNGITTMEKCPRCRRALDIYNLYAELTGVRHRLEMRCGEGAKR